MNCFQTKLYNVSIGGTEYENVQVVSEMKFNCSSVPNGFVEVPSGYEALDILGCAYFPNDEIIFKKIDEKPQEPTQLDRIESQLLDIQAYQVEQAYEAAMAAIEGV